MRFSIFRACCLLAALLLAGVPEARAQVAETASVVVIDAPAQGEVGMSKVGRGLLPETGPRTYQPRSAPSDAVQAVAQAVQQREDEVTTAEFTRGGLIGGVVGAAAGAVAGALLGGDANPRWETALPLAMGGLALGAPAGVYLSTGGSPRYFWGTAGAAGAVAAGTALYFVETR